MEQKKKVCDRTDSLEYLLLGLRLRGGEKGRKEEEKLNESILNLLSRNIRRLQLGNGEGERKNQIDLLLRTLERLVNSNWFSSSSSVVVMENNKNLALVLENLKLFPNHLLENEIKYYKHIANVSQRRKMSKKKKIIIVVVLI